LRFVPDKLSARDFADTLTIAAMAAGLGADEVEEEISWLLARRGVA
jgi:hypothetical protein